MATNFLWGSEGSVINLLTTELNSLTNGYSTAFGPEVDNTTNRYQEGRLAFKLASSSSALTSASFVAVYFVTSNDGTNYPKLTRGSSFKFSEINYLAATIQLYPGTLSSEVLYENVRGVLIPSGKFKTVLVNQSGVTLPSSGNTLDLYPTPSQY